MKKRAEFSVTWQPVRIFKFLFNMNLKKICSMGISISLVDELGNQVHYCMCSLYN